MVHTHFTLRIAGAENSVPALFFRYAFNLYIIFLQCRQHLVKTLGDNARHYQLAVLL